MTKLPENSYGHQKRLVWLQSKLQPTDRIVELGCGTGYMITYPLLQQGFDVVGLDLDEDSITHGQLFLHGQGLDGNRLYVVDFADFETTPDVVIASEVLEHIPDQEMDALLAVLYARLSPNGKLLVTVPNGYGWFEFEALLWFKIGIGKLLEKVRITSVIHRIKLWLIGPIEDYAMPSTLSSSPHVQHFTYRSIQRLLSHHGFEITSVTGSTLFAGPFSDLLFKGINPLMKLNNKLGDLFPRFAAGFYLDCRISTSTPGSEFKADTGSAL